MFDELQRQLRKLSQQNSITLSISIPDDEDGYLDRECPNDSCEAHFKVFSDDYSSRVDPDGDAYCAFCRHTAIAGKSWFTQQQADYIQSVAHQEVGDTLVGAMEKDARRQNSFERKRPKGGLIDIGMTMQVKRGTRPLLVPPKAGAILQQRFACSACEFRWASLGASFFCHACGHNCVATTFDKTIETVRGTIAGLDAIREALSIAQDDDTAADTVRQLREDQFSRIVGAFECLAEDLFMSLQNASLFKWSGNVFQRIDDHSTLWRDATGSGFEAFLSSSQLNELKLRFQQRHVLGHGQGIVDQRYIDRSGDTSYSVGQRLVVKDREVLSLVELVELLAAGLRALTS